MRTVNASSLSGVVSGIIVKSSSSSFCPFSKMSCPCLILKKRFGEMVESR